MTQQTHPLQAGQQACPAALYGTQAQEQPFHYHPQLAVWVAASAAAVDEVLHSPLCGVRPAGEPVPPALLGTSLAPFFARLLRQNDGTPHLAAKQPLQQALAAVSQLQLRAALATALAGCQPLLRQGDAAALDTLCLQLPLRVMAGLLGWPQLGEAAGVQLLGCVLAGLAATATAAQVGAAEEALSTLLAITAQPPASPTPLSQALFLAWPDAERRAANLQALLLQTHDATAALLANTLHRLACSPALRRRLRAEPTLLAAAIAESMRLEAPVQHTWRVVQHDGWLGGQAVQAGQRVLVLLAAANLDASCHAQPEAFQLQRVRYEHGFGAGVHRCPGSQLALAIAQAVLRRCLARPLPWQTMAAARQLHPVANARWRQFADITTGAAR